MQIPQVYLHLPASARAPPSLLKGFANVELGPGQTRRVTITLSRYDLSVWDVVTQGWKKGDSLGEGGGQVEVSVGRSSRDFRLRGVVPL